MPPILIVDRGHFLSLKVRNGDDFMILLEALNIEHYIKGNLLFHIKRLQIHTHDRIGLVGRNGCGKTTLLNILAGTLNPENGRVICHAQTMLLPQLKSTDTTKSGGEITQGYIREAIEKAPKILFADEPTTNLDTEHIEWLEDTLAQWKGAFVLVSHDRTFLDTLCTTIWELDNGELKEYKGNYSDYDQQKDFKYRQQKVAYDKYETKKKQLERALRQRKEKAERATKTPQKVSRSEAKLPGAKTYFAKKQKKLQKTAASIETRLEKLEKVEKIRDVPPLKMNLPNAETFKGRVILRIEDVSGVIEGRILWNKASFHIYGGEKVAIIGSNGSGKTTFIKKIINRDKGITVAPSVKIGYFSQNLSVIDLKKTILENVRSSSRQNETIIRTVLARLHFFRDDVYKQAHVLSGGERVKVTLAKVLLSDINTLILDEPTNYLDIHATDALESLLKEYEGTVIFVSHDRRLVENVATKVCVIENKKMNIVAFL